MAVCKCSINAFLLLFSSTVISIFVQRSRSSSFFSKALGLNEIVTADPAILEHVLKTNFQNYPKGPEFQVPAALPQKTDNHKKNLKTIVPYFKCRKSADISHTQS